MGSKNKTENKKEYQYYLRNRKKEKGKNKTETMKEYQREHYLKNIEIAERQVVHCWMRIDSMLLLHRVRTCPPQHWSADLPSAPEVEDSKAYFAYFADHAYKSIATISKTACPRGVGPFCIFFIFNIFNKIAYKCKNDFLHIFHIGHI